MSCARAAWTIPVTLLPPLDPKFSGRPSSRLHVMVGVGYPRAVHRRLTLLLSSATASVLVSSSTIVGGTEDRSAVDEKEEKDAFAESYPVRPEILFGSSSVPSLVGTCKT
jgi:hypothetical protein